MIEGYWLIVAFICGMLYLAIMLSIYGKMK